MGSDDDVSMLYEFRVDATYMCLVWTTRIKRHMIATRRSISYPWIVCKGSYEMMRGSMPSDFHHVFIQLVLVAPISPPTQYTWTRGVPAEPELWVQGGRSDTLHTSYHIVLRS